MQPVRLAYLLTHPIQYQSPLLRLIAADPRVTLKVYYETDISARGFQSADYGQKLEWDVPLMEGYDWELLPGYGNHGPIGIWKPVPRGLGKRLKADGMEVMWVHGYARPWHLYAMRQAKSLGLKVMLRDEANPVSKERGGLKQHLKKIYMSVLTSTVDRFLAIGSLNRQYWNSFGVSDDRITLCPYVVDNDFFAARAREAAPGREALLQELGLDPARPVVLFTARFIGRKRAEDAVEAVARLNREGRARAPQLLLVGDGAERERVEAKAKEMDCPAVFAGFRNQQALPGFYAACDVFLLPSAWEPWGLVVNEAMNAGKAVIATNQVGSAGDLLRDGENGYVYPVGDVDALTEALDKVLGSAESCAAMGEASLRIISEWGLKETAEGVIQGALKSLGREGA